jgi:hypothetical protein
MLMHRHRIAHLSRSTGLKWNGMPEFRRLLLSFATVFKTNPPKRTSHSLKKVCHSVSKCKHRSA